MHSQTYAQLLYEVLENKPASAQEKILNNFKNILVRNKHAYLAPPIESELAKIQQEEEQARTTYVSSASELTASQKRELGEISAEPREFSVNPELLGGVAVRVKDVVYNATLRKKIELLKNK